MIPAMPVAERVMVEMISAELVPARKPVVSTDVAFTEMRSAMVDAGKMTSADVTSPEVSPAMATAACPKRKGTGTMAGPPNRPH